jgi:hypothetical protein
MTIKDDVIRDALSLSNDRNTGSSNHWDIVSQDIRTRIINGDIENFLSWRNIIDTMFVNSVEVAKYEYEKLQQHENWEAYKHALVGLWPGNPTPSTIVPFTNNNALHQAYHLSLYEKKFGSILKANKIIEFGGGYGCLCSLIRRMGYTGEYTIIDFPEFHLIQKYYLHSLDITNFKQTTALSSEEFNNAHLFAFWSLSETEPSFRMKFINDNFNNLKTFMLAYQEVYESYNNIQLFDIIKKNSVFNCEEIHLEHIPQNFYILGNKI